MRKPLILIFTVQLICTASLGVKPNKIKDYRLKRLIATLGEDGEVLKVQKKNKFVLIDVKYDGFCLRNGYKIIKSRVNQDLAFTASCK